MTIVDFLEAWWVSVQPTLARSGITARFERFTPEAGMNPVCILHLKQGTREAELVVFPPAEAELVFGSAEAGVTGGKHIDDLRDARTLGEVLASMISMEPRTPAAKEPGG